MLCASQLPIYCSLSMRSSVEMLKLGVVDRRGARGYIICTICGVHRERLASIKAFFVEHIPLSSSHIAQKFRSGNFSDDDDKLIAYSLRMRVG